MTKFLTFSIWHPSLEGLLRCSCTISDWFVRYRRLREDWPTEAPADEKLPSVGASRSKGAGTLLIQRTLFRRMICVPQTNVETGFENCPKSQGALIILSRLRNWKNHNIVPGLPGSNFAAHGIAAQEPGGHPKPIAASIDERPARVEGGLRAESSSVN